MKASQTTIKFIKELATNPISKLAPTKGPRDLREFTYVGPVGPVIAPGSNIQAKDPADIDILFSGKPTVWFLVHQDPTSWMMVVPTMFNEWIKIIDEKQMKLYPTIFYHKLVQTLPLAKDIAKGLIGNTVSTYKEVVDLLNSGEPYHMATCPEGSNCMYDYGRPVADFQQFALIKAALQTGANIGIMTFKQKNDLSLKIKVPFLSHFKENAKGLRIPFLWVMQNPINLVYEYMPSPISSEEFNSLTKEQQKEVVKEVGQMIKDLFETRLEEIPDVK